MDLSSSLFPGLSSNHFSQSGILNKRGLNSILSKLSKPDSKIFSAFSESGSEIFLECHLKHPEKRAHLTSLARDIIVANTILFNEDPNGPESTIVRQTEHLFSLLTNQSAVKELKKLLIKLVLLNDAKLFLPLFNSFMDLYLRNTSSLIEHSVLSNDLKQILTLTRTQILGLRELDSQYKFYLGSKKRSIRKDVSVYLKKISRGVFTSPNLVIDFFNSYGYESIARNLKDELFNYLSTFSDYSDNLSFNYSNNYARSIIVHDRVKDLKDKIKDLIDKKKRR